ncbi:MAG: MFS transporter [Chloroflexi bacterium]|nr:MAG: MFS transporter [Chloroflexota bacterium]
MGRAWLLQYPLSWRRINWERVCAAGVAGSDVQDSARGEMLRTTNRKLIVAAAMSATFLSALDTSIVGTAMPTIVGQLGGLGIYPWVFSAYLLTSTTTVPLYGRLSDMYGRKPMFIAAAALFVLGSALCGVAQSMEQLVAFRAVQGLGAGGIIPVTFTILGDQFSVTERAKISGLFSAVWGSSAVAGPTLGGFIVDWVDWRWIFYINLPFGAACIYLMWRHLHEERRHVIERIDYLGAALLTAAITLLLFGLRQAGEGPGWSDWTTVALFSLSILLLAGFIQRERGFSSPVLPLDLFRIRIIAVVTCAGIFIGGVMFGISSYVPLFVQGVLGGSAIQAGFTVAPFSIAWSGASVLAGRIILRTGYRASVVAGVISAGVGAGLLLLASAERGVWPLAVGSAFVGIGMGLSSTAMIISTQNAVGWAQRGVATATVQFSRTIGGAVFVAALGTLLTAGMASRLSGLDAELQSANALLDPDIRASLDAATLELLRAALSASLHRVYIGMFVLALGAVAIVLTTFPRGSVEDLQAKGGGLGSRPGTQTEPATKSAD